MTKRPAAVVEVRRALLDKMAKLIAQRDEARADARLLAGELERRLKHELAVTGDTFVPLEVLQRVAAYPAGNARTVDTSLLEATPRKLQRKLLKTIARRGSR